MSRVPDSPRQYANTVSPARAARVRLLRRDNRTPRAIRVRPGHGVLADAHRPAPGAYSRTQAWQSRRHYLLMVIPRLLRHPRTRACLNTHGIDADTFTRWVQTESRSGEPRNGRDVRVRPDTVARRAGLSERHVQRCRAAARELGVLVDVLPGRRLTLAESARARYHDGGHLVGFSTVSGFVVPAWLPGLGSLSPFPQGGAQTAETRLWSVAKVALRAPRSDVQRRLRRSPTGEDRPDPPRPRPRPSRTGADKATLGLARALADRVGWLQGTSPWRLRQTLLRFARAGWTVPDLVEAMDVKQARLGWTTPARHEVRFPWAFLARYLEDLDVHADHPRPELLRLRESARPWCGICDPRTRLRGLDTLHRCPTCHPLATRP